MAATLSPSCPAAELISDHSGATSAIRCRIAHETLRTSENPRSIKDFCCGEYTRCPTKRADKHNRDAAPLIDERRGEGR